MSSKNITETFIPSQESGDPDTAVIMQVKASHKESMPPLRRDENLSKGLLEKTLTELVLADKEEEAPTHTKLSQGSQILTSCSSTKNSKKQST